MKHTSAFAPVVVRPGIDPQMKQKLQRILLDAADEEEGRQILKDIMVDRFVEGDDQNYASIRAMNSWLARQGGNPDAITFPA